MYRLTVIYEGYDVTFDELIRTMVSSKETGSGFGMGERDMSFEFKTLEGLTEAGKRIKNSKKLKRKVEVLAYNSDNKIKLPR